MELLEKQKVTESMGVNWNESYENTLWPSTYNGWQMFTIVTLYAPRNLFAMCM